MKKIILLMFIFFTVGNAQLSDKQLKYYLEASGEIQAYETSSQNLVHFLDILNIRPKKFPAIDRLAKQIMNDPKLKNIYFDTFRTIPQHLYDDIVSFYRTDTGKKFASNKKIHLNKSIKLSKENRGKNINKNYYIVQKIIEAFREKENLKDRIKKYYFALNRIFNNDVNITKFNQELNLIDEQYIKKGLTLYFLDTLNDLTEEDLNILYQYAKTDAGKIDTKIRGEAAVNWLISLSKIAFERQNEIFTMQFCYINSKTMSNEPTMCKPEWLSKEVQKSISRNNTRDQNTTDNNKSNK